MRKFTCLKAINNFQFSKKRRQSAALIIALMIVTVASIMILGTTRTVVTSTFTSNRYGDAVTANNLAWAGIEEGLMKYKSAMLFTPGNNNLSVHYPINFDTGDIVTKNKIVRRKINASGPEIIGADNGIYHTQEIIDTSGTTFDWNYSDYFNDLRISGSDYDIGPSNLPSVNIDSSADKNIIRKDKYFKVPYNNTEIAPYWRIFDLKNYTGDSLTYKVNFKYETSGTGNTRVDFFIKYVGEEDPVPSLSNDWSSPLDGTCDAPVWTGRTLNKKLCNVVRSGTCTIGATTYTKFVASDCYDNVNAPYNYYDDFLDNGHYSRGNYYINDNHILSPGSTGTVDVFIPPPQNGNVGNNVEYLAIKFTFSAVGGSLTYGIYQDSTGTGYIGQGMTNISSTGIYNNIRKIVELWASKNLKLNESRIITNPEYTNASNPLECKNSTQTILSACPITVYRDTKY